MRIFTIGELGIFEFLELMNASINLLLYTENYKEIFRRLKVYKNSEVEGGWGGGRILRNIFGVNNIQRDQQKRTAMTKIYYKTTKAIL